MDNGQAANQQPVKNPGFGNELGGWAATMQLLRCCGEGEDRRGFRKPRRSYGPAYLRGAPSFCGVFS